jgi:hypothetical protein
MAISLSKRSGSPTPLSQNELDTNWSVIEAAINTLQAASSGSGTVTTFSAGNLSELFTTSVNNASTTPALSFTAATKAANLIFAGPTTGSAAAPTFRSLVAADLPTVPTTKGGLGLTTLGGANTLIKVNAGASDYESTTIVGGSSKLSVTFGSGTISLDVAEANINLAACGGIVPLTKGGTGETTRQAAINTLTNTAGGSTGQVLTRNGSGNAVWSAAPASGIVSLNGLTGGTQTFSASSNGLSVSSAGTTHTFSLAAAGAAQAGAMTSGAQTIGGVKTLNDAPIMAWGDPDAVLFLSGTGMATSDTYTYSKADEALSVGTVRDRNVVQKTATDTLTYTDNVVLSRQAAAAQYTLPAGDAAYIGTKIEISDCNGVANSRHITVRATGSDTINGSTGAVTMNQAHASLTVRLISATEWIIIAAYKVT